MTALPLQECLNLTPILQQTQTKIGDRIQSQLC